MASRDKIIAKAEKYVSKGKIEDAIEEYERLLKDSPNDVNTLNRIGDLWVRINRPKEAVGVFTQIADHYSRDGFFLKAIAIYKKINKLDPSQLEIYEKLAELYAKQGLAMEAKSQYLVLADYSIKQGNTAAALKTYQRIAELDPNSINIHVKLADLYQQNGQTDEALRQYDRVGRLLLKKGMYDEAVQVFQKAVKIDASNVELVSSLVSALNDAGQHASAIQILETAQSANPGDPQLASLLGQALIGKGNLDAAQSVLEEAVAANADHSGTREALAQLHIKRGDVDQAFEILLPRIDALIRIDDADEAVALLNTILSVDATHPGALEKLVEAHTSANQETHAISAMNSLAEAHIARGDNHAAVTVLEKLVEREPQNEQYKKKLKFVHQQMGIATPEEDTGVGTEESGSLQSEPELAEIGFGLDEGVAEEIPIGDEGDELSLDVEETTSDLSFGLDESAALEFGLGGESGAATASADTSPAPQPVAEYEKTDEDLAFITEHMTEAEVFGKYGLLDRAIEHLNKVIERAPDHVPAYEKLFHTYLEEGQNEQAGEIGNRYIAVLRQQGDDSRAEEIVNELASRGLASAPAGAAPAAAPQPVEESVELEEITIDEEPVAPVEVAAPVDIDQEISLEIEPEAFEEEPATEELSFEDGSGIEIEETSEELSLDFEESAGLDLEPEESAVAPPASTADQVEEIEALELETATEELELTDEAEELELAEEEPGELEELNLVEEEPEELEMSFGDEEPASTVVEPPAGAAPPPPSEEELSEIDFYIEQELLDEASERLEAIAANHPEDPRVLQRLSLIAEKRGATASIAEPETPPALDIEAELLSAIPDDDEEIAPPSPAAEQPAPSLAAEISQEEEEGLFADEDDFFDLAAELEQELEGELDDDISLSEEEQSLEDVFREFKKGVEEQLDAEDYDTHYNLGIAYKEMGLIDEAIGEFQIASKDPKRVVECCSMLGLCFLEKGMPQLAIKWYNKGLEIPEITDEEHLGLLYELGNAHVEVGDTTLAHKTFVEIYGVNSNYRDVADRIKQLENVAG